MMPSRRLPIYLAAFLLKLCAADTGSKVCSECHANIYNTYARTPMAFSSGVAGTSSLSEKFDKSSFIDKQAAFSYAVQHQGTNYFVDFTRVNGTDTIRRRLPFYVGSGSTARAFLLSVDNFLYAAPVTYYNGTGAWNLSPGYERYSSPFLTRAIAPGCLQCHASRLQAIAGTQNGYAATPFLEGGVSCERCHGPGADHIVNMKAGNKTGDRAIVNPAKLKSEERADICSQCHLSGEIRITREGREHTPFVPGQKLSHTLIAFVRTGGSRRMKVTSHVENLAQSACGRASGDRMWCGACHDPHAVPAPAAKAAWFRAKCFACHAVADCKEQIATRRRNQDDCVACHMPRNSVADAEHVVYTDHSIPRRPRTANAKPAPDATLAPFGSATATPRDLGLAYAIVGLREQNKAYRDRAFTLLQQAERASPREPQILSYLADLYKSRAADTEAIRLYERLKQVDPEQVSASAALGAYALEQGNYDEAIRLWYDALTKNPSLVLVRVNLATALIRTGRPTEARAVLEKALEYSPWLTTARDLLRQLASVGSGSPKK